MILGIYGDSYCNLNLDDDTKGKSWLDELCQIKNVIHINNYGLPGSSLIKCYKDYIETANKNDINVFVIPCLDRIYFPQLNDLVGLGTYWYANKFTAEFAKANLIKIKNLLTASELDKAGKIVDSINVYYEYWKSPDIDILLNKTFALNLIEKSNNTVFLYTDAILFDRDFALLDLSQWEMNQLGWRKTFTEKNIHYGTVINEKFLIDARKCHLAEENNIILAHKIKNAMDKNEKVVHINVDDFVKPSKSLDFYYEWESVNKNG